MIRNIVPTRQSKRVGDSFIYNGDALTLYDKWPAATCIISDGPYGLGKFPGEQRTPIGLAEWYAPHIAAWSAHARPDCTLWFWNTELGWANVHPVLEQLGWQYEEACVWDKGIAHIAGNVNSKTIRGLPVATELAVRYSRKNFLTSFSGEKLSLKDWVRAEWLRSGLPMHLANGACGVANAATRKYLTKCHLWYFPPAEAIERMARFCEKNGRNNKGWPYFSLDGSSSFNPDLWVQMRSKWNHKHGQTNVFNVPPVHGSERIKAERGYLHANQKPLSIMKTQIESCTDIGDVLWEPFGGLCSASVAAQKLNRRTFAAEINQEYFNAAVSRLMIDLEAERNQGEAA